MEAFRAREHKSHSAWEFKHKAKMEARQAACPVASRCMDKHIDHYTRCGEEHNHKKKICKYRDWIINGKEYAEDVVE